MNNVKKTIRQRIAVVMVLDALLIAFAYFAALWIRFDFQFNDIRTSYINTFLQTIFFWIVLSMLVFRSFGLYRSIWLFVSVDELLRIIEAYAVLAVISTFLVLVNPFEMPRSYYVVGLIISFGGTTCLRFGYRFMRQLRTELLIRNGKSNRSRVMIIGAGEAGRSLLREFATVHTLEAKVVCLIDDNPAKKHRILEGIEIVGGREDIPQVVKDYRVDKIVFAIPSASGQTKKEILDICNGTGCEVQVVPGIYQLMTGEVKINNLRNVEVQDLLGRDPISVNLDEICHYIAGKRIMVTGGGGSIGSELCRQIAKSNPEQLIIFDIYENNAYDIQMELKRHFPTLNLAVLIGSVRNTARLDYVLGTYQPEIVFHAAAHKHVPLMEESPNEAIKNNVFGTYKMAKASAKYGVGKFVLISTDKAVNPTNIMGASKRICEMVVQMMNRECETDFVAVRFGNVLGSNGSVIPLFKKQIAEGGPVTVTHPDIIRYFMTIPEAVSLVLQAGYYAKGGEIFVLDMGAPVKIADMARNLIRLSGLEPDVDIKIEYTGLRPGEKLFEELLMGEEGLQETENKLIHIGKPIEMDDEKFKKQLDELEEAYKVESPNMKELVAKIVPTYHIDEQK